MSDMPLSHDEHKIISANMLDETKNLTSVAIKIIGEGISNNNRNLENIRLTLIWFHILGDSYFKGNFADRGRYEILVLPDFVGFFNMIITYLRELKFMCTADTLLSN